MDPKLRHLTDAISQVVATDGFALGKTASDYIPFRKEQHGMLLEYNFDVLSKNVLQVEARIRLRHHQTEEIFNRLVPPENVDPVAAALRTPTLYASVGRIAVWKLPFWYPIKDPFVARTPLWGLRKTTDYVARAIEKQKELYLKHVRAAFAELSSLGAIEQHLNQDIAKEALYAESRFHRATRGIVTAKICGRPNLTELIAAHRAMLVKHKYADKMEAYDKLARQLQAENLTTDDTDFSD